MRTADVKHNQLYRTLVPVGLVSYGVVHLVVAWIALQVAWGGRGEASSEGALREVGRQPLGTVLLWVMAAGMLALAVWQVFQATGGYAWMEPDKRLRRRASSAARVVIYLLLGVSAARLAVGARSSGGDPEQTLTARLLRAPLGQALVLAVAVAVLAVGVSQIVRGAKKKFREDLRGASQTTTRLGVAGYVAKGVAFGIIGVLFGWAALASDADKAGGLDAALKAIRDQPFGSVLLTLMAAGILAFGLFCFSWARNARY